MLLGSTLARLGQRNFACHRGGLQREALLRRVADAQAMLATCVQNRDLVTVVDAIGTAGFDFRFQQVQHTGGCAVLPGGHCSRRSADLEDLAIEYHPVGVGRAECAQELQLTGLRQQLGRVHQRRAKSRLVDVVARLVGRTVHAGHPHAAQGKRRVVALADRQLGV